jgi:hypothetical protein
MDELGAVLKARELAHIVLGLPSDHQALPWLVGDFEFSSAS